MSSNSVKEWINSSLSLISSQKFSNCRVKDVEIKPLSDQTIICASDIFRVTVILQNQDGDTHQVKAIFKKDPTKENFEKLAQELKISDNEEMVYNKILKPMEELLTAKGEEPFWPECYLSKDKCLLLEDLCEQNYKCMSTSKLLDIPHTLLAMKAIGKYHALGLILKQRGIIDINTLPSNMHTRKTDLMVNLLGGALRKLAEVAENDWEPEWKPFGEKLRKATETIGEKLCDLVTSTQGKCSVICHGDYNMRNMIYHYHDVQKQENPIGIKLLDFQLPNWSNLGFDLASLLGGSILPQIREENFNNFLNAYASTFSETCSKYGYDGYIPTLKDIQDSLQSFRFFMALYTFTAIPALMGAADDFEIGSVLEESNDAFKSSYFNYKPVQEAMKYQLKLSLNQNIL